jgi:large subunit ribosomal protein L17
MRHAIHRHQLGRKKEHRSALMANLAAALFTHGSIRTTLAKAKALRPFAEKVITLAVKAHGAAADKSLHFQRLAIAKIHDQKAVRKLFKERASEFVARPGGYTRIYKLGTRVGDAAEMAVIQLIPADDTGHEKRKRRGPGKVAAATPAAIEAAAAAAAEATAVDVETPVDTATEAEAAAPESGEAKA